MVGWSLAFACLSSLASGVGRVDNLAETLKGLGAIRVERKESFELNYPDTQCVDISLTSSSEKVGFICRSTSRAFVADMGITAYEELAPSARPKGRPNTGLVVGTPMAQYGMRVLAATKGQSATADIDCDTESGPNYRATATCHVAVSRLDRPIVTYSNFVLQYHLDNRRGISRAQILEIWRRLDRLVVRH